MLCTTTTSLIERDFLVNHIRLVSGENGTAYISGMKSNKRCASHVNIISIRLREWINIANTCLMRSALGVVKCMRQLYLSPTFDDHKFLIIAPRCSTAKEEENKNMYTHIFREIMQIIFITFTFLSPRDRLSSRLCAAVWRHVFHFAIPINSMAVLLYCTVDAFSNCNWHWSLIKCLRPELKDA